MPQTTQNKIGILLPNGSSPIFDSAYPAGNRGAGSTYTFTGSGFGTKASTAYFETFDSESTGAAVSPVGNIVLSTGTNIDISTGRAYYGSKSLINTSYSTNYFPKPYIPLSGTRDKVYAACRLYITGDVTAATVWKMWRIGSPAGSEYSGTPRAGESWTADGTGMPNGTAGEIVNSDGITSYWAQNLADAGAEAVYDKDRWMFVECEFYAGTVNNSDAYMRVTVDGVDVLLWVNRPYLTTATPDLPDWILLPCQGIDGSPACSVNWDCVYLDESRARVVMTDNATYTSSTKWDIQPITAYSDTSITTTKVTPSFTGGATIHAHLFRDNGTYAYLGTRTA